MEKPAGVSMQAFPFLLLVEDFRKVKIKHDKLVAAKRRDLDWQCIHHGATLCRQLLMD
jgi:hypothetical protein